MLSIVLILAFVMLFIYLRNENGFATFLYCVFLGIAGLVLFNLYGNIVQINVYTLLTSSLLGMPSILFMLLLKTILM